MLHKIITLVFALILFTDIFAQDLSHQNYFPAGKGNTWEYSYESYLTNPQQYFEGYFITGSERDTIMPNGKKYLSDDNYGFIQNYFRTDSSCVYIYDPADSTDKLFLDFRLGPGDSIALDKVSLIKVVSVDTLTIFNERTRVIGFHIDLAPDNIHKAFFSDRFGVVEFEKFNYPDRTVHHLTGCRIDGQQYGLPLKAEKQQDDMIKGYSLGQNYPNPFNPSTTIRYSTSAPGHVKISLYNVTGRMIAIMVDEFKPAGDHSVTFNASSLPSGVYFYRMESGGFSQARKLSLVK